MWAKKYYFFCSISIYLLFIQFLYLCLFLFFSILVLFFLSLSLISSPNSSDNNSKLFKLFNKLVEEKGGGLLQKFLIIFSLSFIVISRAKLKFLGRELIVEKSHDTLAYFHFDELCNCVSEWMNEHVLDWGLHWRVHVHLYNV